MGVFIKMWSPTHVQVLVKRAKGLKIKGKNGSNDPFVTIGLGKEKFQTSVVEKVTDSVEWMEQCELAIPSKGNTAEVVLTVLHRNFLGVDEFLGRAALPLSNYDHNEKPKSRSVSTNIDQDIRYLQKKYRDVLFEFHLKFWNSNKTSLYF